ncbi:hypothetical protein TBR22_A05710 [Luteitalea sp. TBR-22]|nr:hypothetical protein TBR22_A05710 [Luteitalea sp. TBR-22]
MAARILCLCVVMLPAQVSAGQVVPTTDAIPVLRPPTGRVLSLHRPTADWKVVTSIVLSIEPTTTPKAERVFSWTQPDGGGVIVCPGTPVPGEANAVSHPDGTSAITCTYQPKEGFAGVETFAYTARFNGGKDAKDAIVEIEVRERGLRWEFKTNATTITSDSPDPEALVRIPDIIGGTSQDFLLSVNWQTMRPRRRLADTAVTRVDGGLLRTEDVRLRPSVMSRGANFLVETGVQSEAVAATVTDVGASATGGSAEEPDAGTTEQQVARRNLVLRGEFNYNATLNADGVGRFVELGALGRGSFSTVLDADESYKEAVGRVLQVVPRNRVACKADLGLRLAVKQAHELDTTKVVSPENQVEPPTNIENVLLFEFVPVRFDTGVSGIAPDDGGDSRRRWSARAEFSPELELLPGHSAPTIGFEISRAWSGGSVAVKITYGVNLSASKGILKASKSPHASTR